jgi:hypothetical protein
MKTSETVRLLGLYASECCMDEALFDRNDSFSRCPKCQRLCRWELVEPVVSWLDIDSMDEVETLAA